MLAKLTLHAPGLVDHLTKFANRANHICVATVTCVYTHNLYCNYYIVMCSILVYLYNFYN